MFLSHEQLVELTGKTRPKAQARWLESLGWRYVFNSEGRVIVHEREAERQLCGNGKSQRRRTEPDLEALNGRA